MFEVTAREIKKGGLNKLPSSEKLKVGLDGLTARKTVLQEELRKIQREEKRYDTICKNIDVVLKKSVPQKDINEQEFL